MAAYTHVLIQPLTVMFLFFTQRQQIATDPGTSDVYLQSSTRHRGKLLPTLETGIYQTVGLDGVIGAVSYRIGLNIDLPYCCSIITLGATVLFLPIWYKCCTCCLLYRSGIICSSFP